MKFPPNISIYFVANYSIILHRYLTQYNERTNKYILIGLTRIMNVYIEDEGLDRNDENTPIHLFHHDL